MLAILKAGDPSWSYTFPDTLMTFLTMLSVILLFILVILLFILSVIRQQFELASELESDLQDTVDWGKKWLVDFNAGKTQLVSFHRSKKNGSVDVKMDGSVFEEK